MLEDTSKWFIVFYTTTHFGLKAGDGRPRGVPEGTPEQWQDLVNAMRAGEVFYDARLAYAPDRGIYSPRNTNHVADVFNTHDADLIELLLTDPRAWREDNLPGVPEVTT